MALPDTSPIPLGTSAHSSKPAFLVKFPQDVWERIIASGSGGVQISRDDAKVNLVLSDRTISMDTQALNSTEIYELSDSLRPIGTATTRLSVPFSVASSSKATEAVRAPNNANNKHKTGAVNGLAARVKQQAAVPLARSHSSPAVSIANGTASGAPVIPLKTRVVQHLALGPASVEEIVGKVGGAETDVMRVVKVVGRQVGEHPPRYSLQPSQYTKIKLADWRYTPEEQARVGELAKEAFDELEIPPGADERVELERKLAEAAAAPPLPDPEPSVPIPSPATVHLRHIRTVPAPSPPATAPPTTSEHLSNVSSSTQTSTTKSRSSASTAASSSTTAKKGVVAREMAKFRAEQARSTSAPASKGANGGASPRASATTPEQASKVSKKRNGAAAAAAVDKAEKSDTSDMSSRSGERGVKGMAEKKRKRDRDASPDFTSSEEDDEEESLRGRAKQRAGTAKAKAPGIKPSAATVEAVPESSVPPTRKRSPLSFKRKSPPQPLELQPQRKSTTPSTTTSERPDDPEELRDRYEELYPAYQQLTAKLIALHRAAEGVEVGEAEADVLPSKEEMEKMVRKWERWHNELTGIRRWFGSGTI